MEVILIRHTSVDVPPGTCYGHSDVPLKDSFPAEAAATKALLEGCGAVDAAYTSTLGRCTRLAAFCGWPDATRDTRLMEINFGEWEMQRFSEIRDPRIQEWYADYLNVAATGGESFMMLYKRVSAFMDELRNRPLQRVAVFAHGGSILCAQIWAGLFPATDAFNHQTPHGGLTRINI